MATQLKPLWQELPEFLDFTGLGAEIGDWTGTTHVAGHAGLFVWLFPFGVRKREGTEMLAG